MGASVAIAALGISWPRASTWHTRDRRRAWPRPSPPPTACSRNKYYVDELYGAVFVRGLALGGATRSSPSTATSSTAATARCGPGLGVNGLAWLTRDIVARLSNFWDKLVVDGCVNLTAAILDNLSYLFRAVQNGLRAAATRSPMLIGMLFLLIGRGPLRAGAVLGSRAMDFYREHLLSIITYTPLLGALCCCSRSSGTTTTRCAWFANAVGLARLPGQPAPLVLVRPAGRRLPVRGEARLDPLHRGPVLSSAWTG